MHVRLIVTLVSLLAVGLAGCLSGDDAQTDSAAMEASYQQALVEGTWPSGAAARDYIESYIMTHPFRSNDPGVQEFMATARDDLEAILEGFDGVEVQRHEYEADEDYVGSPGSVQGTQIPRVEVTFPADGQNILGIKWGATHPEQWVVLSAHYDSVTKPYPLGNTVYGAWDDGAGTATLIALAEAHQDWEFPFTVVYAFFDGEEAGTIGSHSFVRDYSANASVDLVANINTDPPGLNYPCGNLDGVYPVKVFSEGDGLSLELGRHVWFEEIIQVALNDTKLPAGVIDRTHGIPVADAAGTGVRGTSDHVHFGRVGIPNTFIGGTPWVIVNGDPNEHDAALLYYPLHTPIDTLQAMEAFCQQGSLSEGLQTTVDLYSHILIRMSGSVPPPGDY